MNIDLLSGKKILVVEDNSINQMLVKHVLSNAGTKVIDVAPNGVHALDLIKQHQYDLILMDIHMPELDGYQTTQIIRQELGLSIPIVAMTALAIKGEDAKCISLGMNGYVSKPFTIESLYTELERVLHQIEANNKPLHKLSDGEIEVDLSYLNELASNDVAYCKTMINLFLENMPATLQRMEECNHKADWEGVYRQAHYAKSSLSVIKVSKLHTQALQLENTARLNKDFHTNASIINNMKQLFAKAAVLLNNELAAYSVAKQVA
jgi:CheY-like chemotaxis protein/HPt (histidine-containing phosphotransfer) domain-containing protein